MAVPCAFGVSPQRSIGCGGRENEARDPLISSCDHPKNRLPNKSFMYSFMLSVDERLENEGKTLNSLTIYYSEAISKGRTSS